MKVVIYARVSLDDKDQDPERQVLKCKQYCELHDHEVLQICSDYCSGDSDPFKRDQGSKLIDLSFDGIVIFSMDRLSRQHPIKVIRMIDQFKDQGIKIISITEPAFNMESEFSDIILYIMSWFNNYFLTKLKRDVKSGMERARAQGKQIGRPSKKFNKYRAHELLFKHCWSLRRVAAELKVSPATIMRFKRDALKNPVLYKKYGAVQ